MTAMVTDCEAKRPIRSFESFNFLIYHFSFIYLCVQCLRLSRDHRAWDQHRLLWGSDPVAGSGESSCCPHPGDPVLLSSTSLNLTLTASPHPRLTLLPQSNTLHCLHCPPHWIGAGGCLITLSQFPLERQSVFLHFTFSVNHSWADCSEWDRFSAEAVTPLGMSSLAVVGATNLFNACCFSNSPSHFPQETNGARHLRKVHASKKVSTETHSIVRGMFHIVLFSYKHVQPSKLLPFSKLCFFFFYCTIQFSVLKTLSTKYLCFIDSLSFCRYILIYMWQLTSMKLRFLVLQQREETKLNQSMDFHGIQPRIFFLFLCTKPVQLQELGQHGRGQDFISLGLHNGHLVFRCASPVNLRALVSK